MAPLVSSLASSFSALSLLVHPAAAPPVHQHLLAQVHRPVPVLARPGGAQLAVLGATTPIRLGARALGDAQVGPLASSHDR